MVRSTHIQVVVQQGVQAACRSARRLAGRCLLSEMGGDSNASSSVSVERLILGYSSATPPDMRPIAVGAAATARSAARQASASMAGVRPQRDSAGHAHRELHAGGNLIPMHALRHALGKSHLCVAVGDTAREAANG